MKVYALVGKSGTGKSYQAMNLCRKLNIEAIIDDGLFIVGGKIIAGISAKKQDTKIGAVKTALFTLESHAAQVREGFSNVAPESLLVIGTSDKMVAQICARLGIEKPQKTIYIEDITTEEERETAFHQRHNLGKHVIPVPTFQLKKDFSGYFIDALKNFSKGKGNKVNASEKSVVRPTFSYLGNYSISGNVIEAITKHAAKGLDDVISVGRVSTQITETGIVINLHAVFKYGVSIPLLGRRLQQRIASRVSLMTAFNIDSINVEVRAARKRPEALVKGVNQTLGKDNGEK